jgi:uncharacterized protein YihD (DUF1040 family)
MPRPEQRIERMLALLDAAWRRHPDQRLGQLIGNAARDSTAAAGEDYRDPFNVEDDELWAGLERLASP